MFDTVAIETAGAHPGFHVGGGGGQYLKHELFSCERRRREAMLGRGGVVMNLAHFHTPKIIPTYSQGRSNEFES